MTAMTHKLKDAVLFVGAERLRVGTFCESELAFDGPVTAYEFAPIGSAYFSFTSKYRVLARKMACAAGRHLWARRHLDRHSFRRTCQRCAASETRRRNR